MPIRKPKPTSPGLRFVSYPDFAEITKTEPERTLVEGLKKSGGRNANGRKTSRHRGGLYFKHDLSRFGSFAGDPVFHFYSQQILARCKFRDPKIAY